MLLDGAEADAKLVGDLALAGAFDAVAAEHQFGALAKRLQRLLRRRERRNQDWTEATGGPEIGVSDPPSGERMLIAREQLVATEAALKALGERTELVFRRYRVEGASQRQIADELGISLSAVEKHLQKAYRALVELRRRFDAD